MDEQSFDKLTEQAATGLRNDRELYLDVKQELHSHLEEKAEHFEKDGHTPDESIELAKKSFGSPLDVAAELLSANKKRMKLRSLLRLTFGALIVPLAIVIALYMGYGRFVRLQSITGMIASPSVNFPALPFFETNVFNLHPDTKESQSIRQLESDDAPTVLEYWKTHQQDANSRIYYAQYTIMLLVHKPDDHTYVTAMRKGEQIEPQNALYNVLLAEHFLRRGIKARGGKINTYGYVKSDELLNRRAFDLGIAELHKAVKKPYLRTYQDEIMEKRLSNLSDPLLIEDYIHRLAMSAAILFPQFSGYRDLARSIPGCARILISEGRQSEAESVMDTWKPYTMLLLSDRNDTLISQLVISASASILAKDAGPVYDKLGLHAKAEDAKAISERLAQINKEQEAFRRNRQTTWIVICRLPAPRI